MIVHNLSETPSILNTFLSELRDISIQKDRMRFRRNIERMGEIIAYEISKIISYSSKPTTTPLGISNSMLPNDNIVIANVLRAGLPMHQGILNYFDKAENAFISAYRHHGKDPSKFEIIVEYLASPSLKNKVLILADPMLASGKSMVNVYKALFKLGKPDAMHLAAVVAAPEGIEYISNHFDDNTHLWVGAIDEKLNDYGYIIPGLGDAGDLSFGTKLQH